MLNECDKIIGYIAVTTDIVVFLRSLVVSWRLKPNKLQLRFTSTAPGWTHPPPSAARTRHLHRPAERLKPPKNNPGTVPSCLTELYVTYRVYPRAPWCA